MLKVLVEAGALVGVSLLIALILVWWTHVCAERDWSFLVMVAPVLLALWLSLSAVIYYG